MLGRIVGVTLILAIVVLSLVLQTTTPSSAGPLGILIVFIFMYLSALGVLTFLLFTGSRLVIRVSKLIVPRRLPRPLTLLRSYYFSSVIALAPVIFIAMQSVGEVSFYEAILVLLFVLVACFYIAKRTA